MSVLRSVAAVVSAGVLLGAASLTVLAAEVLPAPSVARTELGTAHALPAGTTRVVCAPTPLIAEGATGYDSEFNPVPVTASSSLTALSLPRDGAAAPATLTLRGQTVDLAGSAALVAAGAADAVGAIMAAEALNGVAALVGGGGVWRSDVGDLRALVALPCATATSEVWLVGGSTMLGASSQLTITNPTSTPASVTVSVWGPLGAVDVPLLADVVVAPGASESFLIEAHAPDLERLALRVVSSGGAIGASLLDTQLEGITALGTDTAGATAAPSSTLVLPGVSLGDEAAANANLVRLFNPGAESAIATLSLLTAAGEQPIPGAADVTIDPGAVFDISLASLPPGNHAVAISSTLPLLASAQVARATEGTAESPATGVMERAWVSATEPAERVAVTIPGVGAQATTARVVLANAADQEIAADLTLFGADGSESGRRSITVPARGVAELDPASLGAVGLDVRASAPIHVAVVLSAAADDGELLAVLPGIPDAAAALDVRVTVREQ